MFISTLYAASLYARNLMHSSCEKAQLLREYRKVVCEREMGDGNGSEK